MLDRARDNAIADLKTYGSVEAQHRLFAELRRDDTQRTGGREPGANFVGDNGRQREAII